MPKPKAVKTERFETCAGLSRRAFTLQPDTKFNPEGMFKISLVADLNEPTARAFKQRVDEAALTAFNDQIPERYRDGWKLYLPYVWELSVETGEPTDRVIFVFKRNATVRLAGTGETITLTVPVFDSVGVFAAHPPQIRDNSVVRVHGDFAPMRITTTREAGARMNFHAVKVLRLALPPSPFSEDDIEGGWRAGS